MCSIEAPVQENHFIFTVKCMKCYVNSGKQTPFSEFGSLFRNRGSAPVWLCRDVVSF